MKKQILMNEYLNYVNKKKKDNENNKKIYLNNLENEIMILKEELKNEEPICKIRTRSNKRLDKYKEKEIKLKKLENKFLLLSE